MRFTSRAQQAAVMAALTAKRGLAATGRVLRNKKTYKYGGMGILGFTATRKVQPNPYGDPSERRIAPLAARYALGAYAAIKGGRLAHKAAVKITGEIRNTLRYVDPNTGLSPFNALGIRAREVMGSYNKMVANRVDEINKGLKAGQPKFKTLDPTKHASELAEFGRIRAERLAPIKQEFQARKHAYISQVDSRSLAHGYSAALDIGGHYAIPGIGAYHVYKSNKKKRAALRARIQTAKVIKAHYDGI